MFDERLCHSKDIKKGKDLKKSKDFKKGKDLKKGKDPRKGTCFRLHWRAYMLHELDPLLSSRPCSTHLSER